MLSLRYREGLALIYLYRPDRLDRDLTARAARLLEERGYPCGNADLCVVKLLHQLRERREFPHEIGLFFGLSARRCGGIYPLGRPVLQVCRGLEGVWG